MSESIAGCYETSLLTLGDHAAAPRWAEVGHSSLAARAKYPRRIELIVLHRSSDRRQSPYCACVERFNPIDSAGWIILLTTPLAAGSDGRFVSTAASLRWASLCHRHHLHPNWSTSSPGKAAKRNADPDDLADGGTGETRSPTTLRIATGCADITPTGTSLSPAAAQKPLGAAVKPDSPAHIINRI